MKRALLLALSIIFISIHSVGQCPNDVCTDAISVLEQTPTSFCNVDCTEDYNLSGTSWLFPSFPCSYMNYDMWFVIEVNVGGMVEFYVNTEYYLEGGTVIGNFGPLEGVTLEIYSGNNCNSLDFVTGTNCYWLSEAVSCCFGAYDPTRQEWYFTVEMNPGTYYINIDGFGYSVGCGEWWWSEPYFLGLGVNELRKVKSINELMYNILGQRIK
jgi:hypothetical protein